MNDDSSLEIARFNYDPDNDFIVKDGILIRYTGSERAVAIPSDGKIVEIGGSAFSGNGNIEYVTVPGCVARIRGGAFAGCGGLLHVSISEEVEAIEEDAFADCASLLWIAVYGRNTAFANQDFCSDTIVYCYGDSLARETCEAMAHCKVMDLNRHSPGLFNVVKLPSNLMTIGGNAFSGINADVIVVPARTMALGDGAFSGIDSLEFVFIPAGVCDIGADVFAGSDGVWIVCEEGSEAEGFARENNIPIFDLEKWMKLIG